MPVFNSEKFVSKAILSILNQSFENWELLIFNDASTDSSLKIINHFHDHRIKIFNFSENHGIIFALNYLISVSNGQFLARMDSDDISMPDRIKIQLNYLMTNPNVSVVGSWTSLIDVNGSDMGVVWHVDKIIGHEKLFFKNNVTHSSVMIRANVLKSNPYDFDYIHAEDFHLWSKLSYFTQIHNIQQILVHYRVHDKNISNRYYLEQKQTVKNVYKFHFEMHKINLFDDECIDIHYDLLHKHLNINSRILDLYKVTRWLIHLKKELYKSDYKTDYHLKQIDSLFFECISSCNSSIKYLISKKYYTIQLLKILFKVNKIIFALMSTF
jgi:glycosyltransferase involved in cell wall biosynthesis